ncbi:amino acid--tRNA ligase-related protein, partial [Lactobacillus paragasseri]|uniref:amino acid--tRNA ligase-related protein n=1 Tax=Lactobacillus paragasseri TaxID=2107999 RepID=UPI003D286DEF
ATDHCNTDFFKQKTAYGMDLCLVGSEMCIRDSSGFGMGFERTIAWICKLDHIREAIPFPRLINRMQP